MRGNKKREILVQFVKILDWSFIKAELKILGFIPLSKLAYSGQYEGFFKKIDNSNIYQNVFTVYYRKLVLNAGIKDR